ncbi:DNA-processing protein DprA [Vibrio ziniensis]|uniref:DNA-protecting protein DprA n=1 Tax=Vibrio ziniensis TaxID=2711221 RepID=A0A6G7CEJ0_9VIBR|nr:DNA-processing protein DprA [Vibrio ziniensis]QIH40502.1 DNA-protecting protein DprA [Vibrio ziniensis]
MEEHKLAPWLALNFTPKLSRKAITHLLSQDSLSNLSRYSAKHWHEAGLSSEQIHYLVHDAQREVDESLLWLSHHEERYIITPFCDSYPALLQQISSKPNVLFVEGQLATLNQPQIAIVGSRNASIDSQKISYQFAAQLVEHDLLVTSGLALGVDGYAHDGALKAGGKTVAVLGSGLSSIYPMRHKNLAQRICENGALVSEFRPNAKPRPVNFPRRNRIISGLSMGVLVVEAAEKSGSLITARYAMEQNRDVFVVPGSVFNPNSFGSNGLIRQGACLVQNVQHILDEINSMLDFNRLRHQQCQQTLFLPLNSEDELPFDELLANVGEEATPVDILASRTHIPVQEVMMQLLELELSGHVVAVSGGYIRKGRG